MYSFLKHLELATLGFKLTALQIGEGFRFAPALESGDEFALPIPIEPNLVTFAHSIKSFMR
jgi:hypothetical protein